MERVAQIADELAELVGALDPESLSGEAAAALVGAFTRLERTAVAGRLQCARRVADTDAWTRAGYRSPEEWLAHSAGISTGAATADLATAERLESLPATREALVRGRLSAAQTREVVQTAALAPHAEQPMLDAAEVEGLRALQARGRAARAAAMCDDAARHERIRRGRYLRHWTDEEGAFRLDAKLLPEDGAELLARLRPLQDARFHAARKSEACESPQAYAADALVDMARSGGASRPSAQRGAKVLVRVDLTALRRGHLEGSEVCDIAGVGPVPVASARALLGEALVAVVITDGVDVASITHLGRHIPAALRTALEWQYPTCVDPGCDRVITEIDHAEIDFAAGGPTALWNLRPRCSFHHDQKTHRQRPPPAA